MDQAWSCQQLCLTTLHHEIWKFYQSTGKTCSKVLISWCLAWLLIMCHTGLVLARPLLQMPGMSGRLQPSMPAMGCILLAGVGHGLERKAWVGHRLDLSSCAAARLLRSQTGGECCVRAPDQPVRPVTGRPAALPAVAMKHGLRSRISDISAGSLIKGTRSERKLWVGKAQSLRCCFSPDNQSPHELGWSLAYSTSTRHLSIVFSFHGKTYKYDQAQFGSDVPLAILSHRGPFAVGFCLDHAWLGH